MFDNLTALGYGLVAFALVIGVGLVVLSKFSTSIASCPTGQTINGTTNCVNATGSGFTFSGADYNATQYLITQFGSTGLAGWVPAVIALVIGLLFLGAFLAKKGRSY